MIRVNVSNEEALALFLLKFDLVDAIKEYIKDRDSSLKDSEYLIIGKRGALRRDAINTMLERLTGLNR